MRRIPREQLSLGQWLRLHEMATWHHGTAQQSWYSSSSWQRRQRSLRCPHCQRTGLQSHWTWCPGCNGPIGRTYAKQWPTPAETTQGAKHKFQEVRSIRQAYTIVRKLGDEQLATKLKARLDAQQEELRKDQPLDTRIAGCKASLEQRDQAMKALSAAIAADTARLEQMRADANAVQEKLRELEAQKQEQIDFEGGDPTADEDTTWMDYEDEEVMASVPHYGVSEGKRCPPPQPPPQSDQITSALAALTQMMGTVLERLTPQPSPRPQKARKSEASQGPAPAAAAVPDPQAPTQHHEPGPITVSDTQSTPAPTAAT